jgi:DNA-binding transcriptional LysR family regulator
VELRHVRQFLAVAEERSLLRSTSIGQQIRYLEEELGDAQFHRLPHGAGLTSKREAASPALSRDQDRTQHRTAELGVASAVKRFQAGNEPMRAVPPATLLRSP